MIRRFLQDLLGAPSIVFVLMMAAGFAVAVAIANGMIAFGGRP